MNRAGSNGTIAALPARPLGGISKASAAVRDLYVPGKFGATLVSFYIFLIVSRVLDVSPIWWMHIPMVLLIVLIVLTLARGGFQFALGSKITRFFLAFTIWMIVCLPFSEWRGASIDPMESQLQALVIFFVVTQMLRRPDDWRKAAGAYAYAVVAASLYSFYSARSIEGGRLALMNGSLADPNEFALTLVIGLPFWWFKAITARGVKKLFFLLCTVPIYITFARTGSRSGLFALIALLLAVLIVAKGAKRLNIAIGAVILTIGGAAFLPSYLRDRYLTIFSPAAGGAEAAQLGSDIASSEGRKQLLIQSIDITFHHPVFGVGPGVFSYAAFDQRKDTSGFGGLAQVTHNTYTQISSETGLPGLFFLLGTLFLSIKYVYCDYRRTSRENSDLAKSTRYLFVSFIGMSIGIFFLSVGYTYMVGVMFALAVSLHNIVQAATASATQSAVQSAGTGTAVGQAWKPAERPAIQALKPLASGLPARLRPTYLGSRSRAKTPQPPRTRS